MSKIIKTKPQELKNIPGVKDLTNEKAAITSGGLGITRRGFDWFY